MAFDGSIFGRYKSSGAEQATGYGLGFRHRRPVNNRPTFSLGLPRQSPFVSQPQRLGDVPQQPQSLAQPAPVLGQPVQTPASQSLGSTSTPDSNPLDPFGTQASGGQYGNLSGTPAIFGASDYGGPGPGTLNASPEAQAILAQAKAAAMNNFNQGLDVTGQPTTAGQRQLQPGQVVGDNQWNGTAWVPRNYGAAPQGFFGGSNPGGY